jgi:hypothetical protein
MAPGSMTFSRKWRHDMQITLINMRINSIDKQITLINMRINLIDMQINLINMRINLICLVT